ncbi:iron permease FTR1 [Ephemerocybe angulata]|uniref:Iron permease FTR1 n=1 Tax=Ephemerocybe angulata TaxID=980116 RepID=A0A8H6M7E7_9AGAR|nr:iron permease FTR1 [Tulosesus angulatus]
MPNLFSVPIFFIVFRETLEASIIISVLLGLAEQIVNETESTPSSTPAGPSAANEGDVKETSDETPSEDETANRRRLLIRKLRIQIFAGAAAGLLLALGIGAAFIAVWFTKASNLWEKAEQLWEAIFNLIAAVLIFVMGVTMLKMDKAKIKWRLKVRRALEGRVVDSEVKTGKWVLFILPFVTVLREGMEAVVFVGGVSLGQTAKSIPIAAIVGIICGLVVGFLIYEFASRSTLTIFLVVMTNILLLIGAGLFSKAVGGFERHAFNKLLGGEAGEGVGDGPGTFKVQGNVWHLDCCNPENKLAQQGWSVFTALFGWNNNATLGTVLSYVFYWIAVIVALVYMKFAEGRTKLFGRESKAAEQRRLEQDEPREQSSSDPELDERKEPIAEDTKEVAELRSES